MMNKKGAELSFNVIIVAILVILVLVVIASFFLGGFSKLSEILFGVKQSDLTTATTLCTSYCSQAQTYDSDILRKNSEYCRKSWKFDNNEDGLVDKDAEGNIRKYHCAESPVGVKCPGVEDSCL